MIRNKQPELIKIQPETKPRWVAITHSPTGRGVKAPSDAPPPELPGVAHEFPGSRGTRAGASQAPRVLRLA